MTVCPSMESSEDSVGAVGVEAAGWSASPPQQDYCDTLNVSAGGASEQQQQQPTVGLASDNLVKP